MTSSLVRDPLGKKGLSFVDKFGIFLSLLAIKKFLPKKKQLDILDLGCGYNAKLLVALKSDLNHGTGVDFSIHPGLKSSSQFSFIESSIEDAIPQLTEKKFHVILLTSILEHLNEPLKVLTACKQLLHADGVLLINVPTWRGKFFLEFSAFKLGTSPKEEMEDHKMYYDKRDLWPLLVKAGFKPSQIKLKYHKFGLNLFATAKKNC